MQNSHFDVRVVSLDRFQFFLFWGWFLLFELAEIDNLFTAPSDFLTFADPFPLWSSLPSMLVLSCSHLLWEQIPVLVDYISLGSEMVNLIHELLLRTRLLIQELPLLFAQILEMLLRRLVKLNIFKMIHAFCNSSFSFSFVLINSSSFTCDVFFASRNSLESLFCYRLWTWNILVFLFEVCREGRVKFLHCFVSLSSHVGFLILQNISKFWGALVWPAPRFSLSLPYFSEVSPRAIHPSFLFPPQHESLFKINYLTKPSTSPGSPDTTAPLSRCAVAVDPLSCPAAPWKKHTRI